MSLKTIFLMVLKSDRLIEVPQASNRGRDRKSCDRMVSDCARGAQPGPWELLQSQHLLTNTEALLRWTSHFWPGLSMSTQG